MLHLKKLMTGFLKPSFEQYDKFVFMYFPVITAQIIKTIKTIIADFEIVE